MPSDHTIHTAPDRQTEPPSAGALALVRLSASRERLAQRLLPAPPPPREPRGRRRVADGAGSPAFNPTGSPQADNSGWADTWQALRAKLTASPIGPVLDTGRALLEGWWQRQPWRSTAEAVGTELRATVGPLAQRHPWGTVLLSAGVAAAVVWLRPWQAGWLRPHVQPLPQRAGAWLVRQASLLPLQAVVPALLAAWRLSQQAPTPPSPTPAPPAPPAPPATRDAP